MCASVFAYMCMSACVYVCIGQGDCAILHFILAIFENICSNIGYYIHLDNQGSKFHLSVSPGQVDFPPDN